MSMYKNQQYGRFLGQFSDLSELQSYRPIGEDGEYAFILSSNIEYYWDISDRQWKQGSNNITLLLEQIIENQGNIIPEYDDCSYTYDSGNLETIVYTKNGETILTITFTYVGGQLTNKNYNYPI